MYNTTTFLSICVVVVAAALIGTFFFFPIKSPTVTPPVVVTSFAECEKAGYPVMESYPRQCHVPGGTTFVEVIVDANVSASTSGEVLGESISPEAFSGK